MAAMTPKQKQRAANIVAFGCAIDGCQNEPMIHHCETGGGGRRDHNKIIGLCHWHHQGEQGIHTLSRRIWEPIYGTEQELMKKVAGWLGEL